MPLAPLPIELGSSLEVPRRRSGMERDQRGMATMLRAPAWILLAIIRLYQRSLSPLLPVVTLGACACRFSPTCSEYAAEAIRGHGVLKGISLAAWRLLRCTPLTAGGFDPVPVRRGPVCRRVTL